MMYIKFVLAKQQSFDFISFFLCLCMEVQKFLNNMLYGGHYNSY